MVTTFEMPLCNENMAPKFDSTKPRELPQFFEDLEQLFFQAQIEEDETKKKLAIIHYVNYTMEQMWKTFPEFKSPVTSYQDFKKAILEYYPNASGDFIYSLQNMDILVGECLQNGIISPTFWTTTCNSPPLQLGL